MLHIEPHPFFFFLKVSRFTNVKCPDFFEKLYFKIEALYEYAIIY
jgi:hypothetical protein